MAVAKRAILRARKQLKRYNRILADARARDINESDTVTIIIEMLSEVFGYDKFTEITKEFAIRGTYCDIAVNVKNDTRFLVEAKAIGVALKDKHVKQCIDYAANHGIEWVVLSNGAIWRVYKVHFRQPIDKSLVFEVDLLEDKAIDRDKLHAFANLSREGFKQSSMTLFYRQQQALSRFSLAALLLDERVLNSLRRAVRKAAPRIKTDTKQLALLLKTEVLKREVVDGEEAERARENMHDRGRKLRSSRRSRREHHKGQEKQEERGQSEGHIAAPTPLRVVSNS
jgi:hypothetical protein